MQKKLHAHAHPLPPHCMKPWDHPGCPQSVHDRGGTSSVDLCSLHMDVRTRRMGLCSLHMDVRTRRVGLCSRLGWDILACMWTRCVVCTSAFFCIYNGETPVRVLAHDEQELIICNRKTKINVVPTISSFGRIHDARVFCLALATASRLPRFLQATISWITDTTCFRKDIGKVITAKMYQIPN